MEKLNQEQLAALKSARDRVIDIRNSLADIVITEERCATDKKRLMFEYNQSSVEFKKINKEIVDLYGDNATIDMETGDVIYD